MTDEMKIRSILLRIDALHEEVEALLPKPEPVVVPPPEPELVATPEPVPPPAAHVPSAFETFLAKVGDWFCVRGDFAPKGVTREFAVATRWLVRTGSVILVGAIAYFLILAIDRGWIGPVQRTYSMMAWGVAGAAFGTWLKARNGRYAMLGEVFAALGLVGLYLSFGLGHRYFRPPVIASPVAAFGGLVAATVAAGVLSIRLRSLMIAILGLVGGFIVPFLVTFARAGQLEAYLAMLALGAAAVAHCRRWTILGFATVAVAFVFEYVRTSCSWQNISIQLTYVTFLFALTLAQTMLGAARRTCGGNGFCWAFVSVAAIVWALSQHFYAWDLCATFGIAAAVLGTLAWGVRRRNWANGTGAPVLMTFAALFANLAIMDLANYSYSPADWLPLALCAFAAVLAELGVRTRERTLQVLSLVMLFVLMLAFLSCVGYGYGNGWTLVRRVQILWCLPPAIGFVAWRVGGKGAWLETLRLPLGVIASVLALVVVSCESSVFGTCYLPSLGLGIVTIVWAVVASALLAGGIVGRRKACRLGGLALLGLSIAKLLFFDTASLAMPGRVGVFAAVGVLLIAGAFLYLKFKSRFEEARG